MNIIYCNFTKGLVNVPRFLNEQITPNGIHLIIDSETEVSITCKKKFLARDCQLGNYPELSEFNSIPIDELLLKSMKSCESTILKMLDRYQFSHTLLTYESRINLYHKQLKFWYNYLIKEKIELCVFAVIPHVVFDYIIYCLCKLLGIRTLMLYRLPVLPQKNVSVYVLNTIEQHIEVLKSSYHKYLLSGSDIVLSNRMNAYLELKEGNENKTFTGIVKRNKNILKFIKPQKYIAFFVYYWKWIGEWRKLWGNPIDLMYAFVYKWQNKPLKKLVFENTPDLSKKYILVSLHYQPECTTIPMGGSYVFQDLMIDLLIKSVPPNILLYIKAHPRDGLSKALRRRIQLDERSILINPTINSFELIVNSIAVATVTGTSGWEAFLNCKPVLMFGNYFYQDAPGVFKIKSFEETKKAINAILNKEESSLISDKMVKAFLKAVDDHSFSGWVDSRYAILSRLSDEENCRNIANALHKEMLRTSSIENGQ